MRDVRVIQRGERLRLAREAGEAIGIGSERLRQDLDRDVAIEPRVARAIDLAHAAGAEQRDDFVDVETRAGREEHEGRRRIIYRGSPSTL